MESQKNLPRLYGYETEYQKEGKETLARKSEAAAGCAYSSEPGMEHWFYAG